MKDFLPTPLGSHKDIPEEVTMRKVSEASAGSRKCNAKRRGTEDSSPLNVEKDLYALLNLCVHLLDLETKKKDISGMQPELRDLDVQVAATLKKEEIFLRKIISVTRKRLRCTDT